MVFIEDVTASAQKLVSRCGFRLAEVQNDPFGPGDATVTLTSPAFDLRFILKRGQCWCDVRAPGKQWFFLNDLAEVLGMDRVPPNLDMVSTVRAATPLIQANLETIGAAFTEPVLAVTLAKLQEIADRRVQTMFRR